jgi:pimeloyl-ACP methyl ester carboxylesterase
LAEHAAIRVVTELECHVEVIEPGVELGGGELRVTRNPALVLLAMLMLPLGAGAQDSSEIVPGPQRNVIFSAYFPLSRSTEIARRALSPLANVEIARFSAQLRPQAIDLAQERFSVYVPAQRPSRGYALLVFIPPWEDARLPPGWAPALDQNGVIFVSAAKSGNEENVFDRRIPLALLGAYNIMQRYPVDPERVYIGGFSGGSRVAMRTALAYPDLFHGALLNAGSDPIGGAEALLPPDDLFAQFQSSTRLVYVTGSDDSGNIQRDMVSHNSMTAWCVFGTRVETMLKVSHDAATQYALRRALSALDQRPPVDAEKLSACRARIAKELAADLQRVTDLIERDNRQDARRSLTKLDIRYGGLAASESIQLEQRIGPPR